MYNNYNLLKTFKAAASILKHRSLNIKSGTDPMDKKKFDSLN